MVVQMEQLLAKEQRLPEAVYERLQRGDVTDFILLRDGSTDMGHWDHIRNYVDQHGVRHIEVRDSGRGGSAQDTLKRLLGNPYAFEAAHRAHSTCAALQAGPA